MNKKHLLVTLIACVVGLANAENPKELHYVSAPKIPRDLRPNVKEGVANIQIVNKSDQFITFGLIGADGNLRHGWTDGKSGPTTFYVGPGSQTDSKYPYRAAVGACFVIFTLEGQFLGYGSPETSGDFVLEIK